MRYTSRSDLKHLRAAARIAGQTCDTAIAACLPGVNTLAIDALVNQTLASARSSAPFKQYQEGARRFGFASCISLNDEVVNRPPSSEVVLQTGDLISIALGAEIGGMHAKAARTGYLLPTGVTTDPAQMPETIRPLIRGVRSGFDTLKALPEAPASLGELLQVIPDAAKAHGVVVLENVGGCGTGKRLHEPPETPNQPTDDYFKVPLLAGTPLVLMPMMALGTDAKTKAHEDGWTLVTQSGELSAHWAETLLVTETGIELLTAS
ncbi:MAG: M24 family metallopeptidase [Vampirovibrionales bacterium]|nr:M24 family metallopeptidase [Vampirovibrionales bacterium]